MGKRYRTEHLHFARIDCETIKVQTNAHHENFLPGQDLMIKIAQIFFDNSCELHIAS